jgi:hypothetical protein
VSATAYTEELMGVSAAIRSGTPTDQQGGATLGKVRTAYSR